MAISEDEVKDLLTKYKEKLETQLEIPLETTSEEKPRSTKDFHEFKKQYVPGQMNLYEKLCNQSEKILKVSPDKKKLPEMQEAIDTCHLNITPSGAASFAILAPMVLAVGGSLVTFALFQSFFFIFFFVVAAAVIMGPLQKMPRFIADSWRMKSSNQMVLCIFYMVTYMRHTSNLERAVDFAAAHLAPPLSLDLKKVIWNVQTEKFENIKESLDAYLETWKKYNNEFVESIHLVESSLYEGDETRRIELLDKSLTVMLEETYEKMLHYAQNLKGPITMLHMMGVILPILGLVILPLVVSFMSGIQWYHIAAIYNVTLPLGVYYLGKNILSKRPTGYGDSDISESNPEFKKYKNVIINVLGKEVKIPPIYFAGIIFCVLFFIGLSPLIMHLFLPTWDMVIDNEAGLITVNTDDYDYSTAKFSLLQFQLSRATTGPNQGKTLGPYGLGSSLLSLGIPLSIGIAMGVYFRLRSQNVIKIRENAKKLEKEFASALFQLGNRLGDGLPAEIAFDKVAGTMQNTVSGSFFNAIATNIKRLGMGIKEAIFDPRRGALVNFPSSIIESSMKVMTESVKKGPLIASQAVINISKYIKEIHRVNERLKDLMADIISSMKSQISFLTPVISGIVIGITSMITAIINRLSTRLSGIAAEGGGQAAGISTMFTDAIPTFYFQLIVGFYVVQIIFILTVLANGIESGSDKLNERYLLGKNMVKSTILYCMISLVIIMIFNSIAGTILG
ncbi:hypothetical protein ACFLZ7_02885 [Nanoarchaeota archaeon]